MCRVYFWRYVGITYKFMFLGQRVSHLKLVALVEVESSSPNKCGVSDRGGACDGHHEF